jgi:hypothetical protein
MPPGDDRSEKELAFAVEDEALVTRIEAADAKAKHINTWSEWLELCSVVALCAAFITIGIGIVKTLSSLP